MSFLKTREKAASMDVALCRALTFNPLFKTAFAG